MNPTRRYRAAIIGGGPAGCAAALALARLGVTDVVIVESGNYEALRIGESIPPDTRLLLERLGVWRDFLSEGHDICYGSCSSWGSDALGYNDFLFNPYGNGWHLDRAKFNRFLAEHVVRADAELAMETEFEGVEGQGEREEEGFVLKLRRKDGTILSIEADFVLDATGHHGSFAQRMGAERVLLDRLICVYGFYRLTSASKLSRMTMLEGVEEGWWYAARLPDGKAAAAFAGDPEGVKRKGLNEPEGWKEALRRTRHIAPALEGCSFIEGGLKAWPALSFILDRIAGERWLAVGDAASCYDPISSQGIHKALTDGIEAGEALFKRMSGDADALKEYAERVRGRYRNYQANRNYFYGLEGRWPESTFWQRRRERRD